MLRGWTMAGKSVNSHRQAAVGWMLGGAFAVATYSQARVQVFERKSILAEANQLAHFDLEKVETAKRGTILSSDGKILAQSAEDYELGLNYGRVPQSPAFFAAVSEAVGIPATELSSPPGKTRGRVWRTPLTPKQAAQVRDVRRRWSADGVSLEKSRRRDYPMGQATAGIVGAMREGQPISGFERSLNKDLSGKDGEYRGFIDRSGMFVVDTNHSTTVRENGAEVTLTIDAGLQMAAMHALRDGVEANKAKSGCAIVIEPKTGEILAMANWPTFEPDKSWKPGEDYNMAYMGAYEPGSTFKILTLAKGLDDGAVKPGDHTYCNGQIVVSKWTMHCAIHNGNRAHGDVDLERAISKSCNVAAATWAMKIGYQPMVEFMDKLGLFEKTDLGLPSERTGNFNRNDYSKKLQLATVGFGQSMGCVPVNLAAAYAMLANEGLMMRPYLIKKVGAKETVPVARGQMVKPETARQVMTMMQSVIESEHGTGKALKIHGYRLAGKTGTAQKVGTAAGKYVANFVGMVPAVNPKAVVLVMVDSPSAGQYYGGTVAGPIFVDIAKSVIRRYNIPPTETGGR